MFSVSERQLDTLMLEKRWASFRTPNRPHFPIPQLFRSLHCVSFLAFSFYFSFFLSLFIEICLFVFIFHLSFHAAFRVAFDVSFRVSFHVFVLLFRASLS